MIKIGIIGYERGVKVINILNKINLISVLLLYMIMTKKN